MRLESLSKGGLSGPGCRHPRFAHRVRGGVQGTPRKVLPTVQVSPALTARTGTWAGVYQTAVTTPVDGGLRPPPTSLHSCRRVRGRYRRFPDTYPSVASATGNGGN